MSAVYLPSHNINSGSSWFYDYSQNGWSEQTMTTLAVLYR